MEVSVVEAQVSEAQVVEFQEWLNHVDVQLTTRIHDDLTASDAPDFVQVWWDIVYPSSHCFSRSSVVQVVKAGTSVI